MRAADKLETAEEASVILSCLNRAAYRVYFGYSQMHKIQMHFYTIFCSCIILLFLVPDTYYKNMYGVLLTALLTIFSFITAKNGELCCVNFRIYGAGLLVFAFFCFASVFTARNTENAAKTFLLIITAFMLYILSAVVSAESKAVYKALSAIYIITVAISLWGIIQGIIGVEIDASLTDLSNNSGMPGRVYSIYGNPNNFAEILVLFFPLSFVCSLMTENKKRRVVMLFVLLLPIIALVMTYSRSSWLGFFVSVLIFVILVNKRLIPYLVCFFLLIFPLLPSSVFDRILTIGSLADSSNMYRIYIWQGVARILQNNFFSGVGLGVENFVSSYIMYCDNLATEAVHSHNLYLEIWVETGILGLISFVIFIVGIIIKALNVSCGKNNRDRLIVCSSVSTLVGISVTALFEYVWFYPRVMYAYFIVCGILVGTTRKIRKKAWRG